MKNFIPYKGFRRFKMNYLTTMSILFATIFISVTVHSSVQMCIDLIDDGAINAKPIYPVVEKGSFADRAIQAERSNTSKMATQIEGLNTTIAGIEKWAQSKEGWKRRGFTKALDRFVQFQINVLTGVPQNPRPRRGQSARDMQAFVRNSYLVHPLETRDMRPNEARMYANDLPKEMQMFVLVADSMARHFDKDYMNGLEMILRTRTLQILSSYSEILTPEQLHTMIKADILLTLQQIKMLQVENSMFASDYTIVDLFGIQARHCKPSCEISTP